MIENTAPVDESALPPNDATARPSLLDLPLVLVRPGVVFGKERGTADVAKLLLLVFAIDFVLSVLLIPAYSGLLAQQLAAQGDSSVQTRIASLGFAVVIGTTINVILATVMAALFLLAQLVLTGRGRFGAILGTLLLATGPTVVDRVVRIGAFVTGLTSAPSDTPLAFKSFGWFTHGPDWIRAAGLFSVFDVWTFVLVCVGFTKVSRLGPITSTLISVLLWGGLQALFARLQLQGVLGSGS